MHVFVPRRDRVNFQSHTLSVSRQWALVLCGLFLLSPAVSGQDIKLGKALTAEQLAEMQKQALDLNTQIKNAQANGYKLGVGDFLSVDPPDNLKGQLLWLVSDEAIVKKIEVPANT